MDPLEFLARVLAHIPDKGQIAPRYSSTAVRCIWSRLICSHRATRSASALGVGPSTDCCI